MHRIVDVTVFVHTTVKSKYLKATVDATYQLLAPSVECHAVDWHTYLQSKHSIKFIMCPSSMFCSDSEHITPVHANTISTSIVTSSHVATVV